MYISEDSLCLPFLSTADGTGIEESNDSSSP